MYVPWALEYSFYFHLRAYLEPGENARRNVIENSVIRKRQMRFSSLVTNLYNIAATEYMCVYGMGGGHSPVL